MKTDTHWERIGKFSHHGVSVPLFSLRTEKNCGIGEFLDLLPVIEWCRDVGFDVVQLLPINDSGSDPSPYNPLSSSALDPVYLSLFELGIDAPKVFSRLEALEMKQKLLFGLFEKEYESAAFQLFVKEHPWLENYAKFKALKQQNQNRHWQEWDQGKEAPLKQIHFQMFLQFHAFRQMEMVKTYADQHGIKIKGDIPILLSPDSADVWADPHLFNLEFSAGAPPDYYNPKGQNWGFPLFNWDRMQKEQFHWWKMRLKSVEKLYHIYRIDHVVGFFRLWGIAKGKSAIDGNFFPSDSAEWTAHGKAILEMMIDASPLLPMAEDLGTIPKEVYLVLKELGICGTKVMRFEKVGREFTPLDEYEPISMTTLGTHDMEPLQSWWEKNPSESIPFAEFLHIPHRPKLGPKERLTILKAAHHTTSLFHINPLQEYLALLPEFTSLKDERINYPGTNAPSNWTYQLHSQIEEFAGSIPMKEAIQNILS